MLLIKTIAHQSQKFVTFANKAGKE